MSKTWFSPAKINVYLAVKGLREDGFHEIDTLVARLDFGDSLTLGLSDDGQDHFRCNLESLKWDPENLVYRALQCFRDKTGWREPVDIQLEKRIPLGAGLGGGSSNVATLFQALRFLSLNDVSTETLAEWSLELGSDCALFFGSGIQRVRGRGEQVEPFRASAIEVDPAPSLLLIHPGFPISAAWAYQAHRKGFQVSYTQMEQVERELETWKLKSPGQAVFRNDLSLAVDQKYLAVPSLKEAFESYFHRPLHMSGSGSACYCWLEPDENEDAMRQFVADRWGDSIFSERCHLNS